MFEFQGRTYGVFVPFLKGFWTIFVEEVSLSIASPLHRSLQGDICHTEWGQAQVNEYSATFFFKATVEERDFWPYTQPHPTPACAPVIPEFNLPSSWIIVFALAPSWHWQEVYDPCEIIQLCCMIVGGREVLIFVGDS